MFPTQEGFSLLLPWMGRMEVFPLLGWSGCCCKHLQTRLVVGGLADGSKCHLA